MRLPKNRRKLEKPSTDNCTGQELKTKTSTAPRPAMQSQLPIYILNYAYTGSFMFSINDHGHI
ncbi:unnamed protein product [Clavelina lepadiformis]|uniref:Uncharacterized protein n=1 Tax=Clavelina lepadiformis TaxID=159417 RepID=A0ABP0FV38_CLALP